MFSTNDLVCPSGLIFFVVVILIVGVKWMLHEINNRPYTSNPDKIRHYNTRGQSMIGFALFMALVMIVLVIIFRYATIYGIDHQTSYDIQNIILRVVK